MNLTLGEDVSPYDSGSIIFVFGSNLAGRHGSGAALTAIKHFGAKYGEGVGRTGNAYGIPTKDRDLEVLPLENIRVHVDRFLEYAQNNGKLTFLVTAIGCGLAGYTPAQIAPMFVGFPENRFMPPRFILDRT